MKASITMALITAALFTGLVSLHACTDADDPALGQQEQEQRAETIEVHGCSPGWIDDGYQCIDTWHGGGWAPGPGDVGGRERDPSGGGGRGGAGPAEGGGGGVSYMDPEPDHDKDRKSCWDWCAWDRRQCEKECKHRHPERDFNERNRCIRSCDTKLKACKADCNSRLPERPDRPIITVSP